MTDKHWAVFALRDIKAALNEQRYDVAACHISDAIDAILARDSQDTESNGSQSCSANRYMSNRM